MLRGSALCSALCLLGAGKRAAHYSLFWCEKMAGEMSLFERSLNSIVKTFHQYSTQDENKDTLNKKEFKQLVQKELPNFLKNESRDERVINDIMEDLDTNLDNQLSFEEATMLFAKLINASHEKMHEGGHHRGPGHSHGPGLGEGSQAR